MSASMATAPAREPRVRVTAPTAAEWQDCADRLAELVERYAPADDQARIDAIASIDALVWRTDAAMGLRRSR